MIGFGSPTSKGVCQNEITTPAATPDMHTFVIEADLLRRRLQSARNRHFSGDTWDLVRLASTTPTSIHRLA